MYLAPDQRIRTTRSGKLVLLPNPAEWRYTPEIIDAIGSRHKSSVLITGPTGSGKEDLAELLSIKAKEFIPINCSGLEGNLIESELFGHVKGSFTGADSNRDGILKRAQDATIFLDEIGRLSLASQARLLRFLQTGDIRPLGSDKSTGKSTARVIAATNQDVDKADVFLPDLRERFEFRIDLPALTDRGADCLYLLSLPQFLGGSSIYSAISLKTVCQMLLHTWPGNIRELHRFCRNAEFYQPFDPVPFNKDKVWPKHILHRNVSESGTSQTAVSELFNNFMKFVVDTMLKLQADPSFKHQFPENNKLQYTAALLSSLPWLLINEPKPSLFQAFLSTSTTKKPEHPLSVPLSLPAHAKSVTYDLTNICNCLFKKDLTEDFDDLNLGPVNAAPLPYFLTKLVQWMAMRSSSHIEGIDPVDFINHDHLDPSIQGKISQLKYPSVKKPAASSRERIYALIDDASLPTQDQQLCRLIVDEKPRKVIAATLRRGESTIREDIARISKAHSLLAPYIKRSAGRPKRK
jgi:hypothetical protein